MLLKQEHTLFAAGHLSKDLMEWTPPRESRHHMHITRFNFSPILCDKGPKRSYFRKRFYNFCHESPKLNKFRFQRGRLSMLFALLLVSLTDALINLRLQLPRSEVTLLDQDDNVVIQLDLRPLKTCCNNWSLLFSAAA